MRARGGVASCAGYCARSPEAAAIPCRSASSSICANSCSVLLSDIWYEKMAAKWHFLTNTKGKGLITVDGMLEQTIVHHDLFLILRHSI